MTVLLFPICTARGIWSFRPQSGAQPVRVRAPKGSEVLPVQGLGLELFVPSVGDSLQRIAWSANAVMREVQAGGRFRLVKTKGRECITG